MASTARIGKGGRGRPGRTGESGGGGGGTLVFVDHPRIFLDTAKKAEISTRRVGNTADWQIAKNYADSVPSSPYTDMTTLTAPLGTGGVGTTFSVTDGSAFPTAATQYRIDVELITATRSGNVMTIVSRQDFIGNLAFTDLASHAAGAEIWRYVALDATALTGYAPTVAMMEHVGQTGYEQQARAAFGQLLAYYCPITSVPSSSQRYSGNSIRNEWFGIALAYDWVHSHLSANEIAVFAPIIADCVSWHVTNAKEDIPNGPLARQRQRETALSGNIANGQVRSCLALAAAIHGDHASADTYWTAQYSKVTNYIVPAMTDGPFSGGNNSEGAEYVQEAWFQTATIFRIIESALGSNPYETIYNSWLVNVVKYWLYSAMPGTSNNSTFTLGTCAAGSRDVTVSSTSNFSVGQSVYHVLNPGAGNNLTVDVTIATDVTPDLWTVSAADVGAYIFLNLFHSPDYDGGLYKILSIQGGTKWRLNAAPAVVGTAGIAWTFLYSYDSVITGIAGSVITLRDPAPQTTTAQTFAHRVTHLSLGDYETYNNFDDGLYLEQTVACTGLVLDRLRTSSPTYASYLRSFIDTKQGAVGNLLKWAPVMFNDPTVAAVDYTAAGLPIAYSTVNANSTGLVLGRSGWTGSDSFVHFNVGSEAFWDHATAAANTFSYRRKGRWLCSPLHGYGTVGIWQAGTPFPPFYTTSIADSPFVGTRYHNGGVLMNGHGHVTALFNYQGSGGATLDRSKITSTYAYGRGDASRIFAPTSNQWTSVGYASDAALTYVRDWLWIKPDYIVILDRLTYSAAALSQTQWNFIYPGDPSMVSQRLSMTYAEQTLVQDFIAPTSAVFTEVDMEGTEDRYLRGYRMEVKSGVSQSSEKLFSVLQGGDSGFTPASVTSLTTTNADIAQIGTTHVVGGVPPGTSPTLPITYSCTGSPAHILTGFAASTAYHVTNVAGAVTIVAATGSGDTTSNDAGILEF